MALADPRPFSTLYVAGACTSERPGAVDRLGASLSDDVAALTADVRAVVARVRRATRAVEQLAAAYDAAGDDVVAGR